MSQLMTPVTSETNAAATSTQTKPRGRDGSRPHKSLQDESVDEDREHGTRQCVERLAPQPVKRPDETVEEPQEEGQDDRRPHPRQYEASRGDGVDEVEREEDRDGVGDPAQGQLHLWARLGRIGPVLARTGRPEQRPVP